MVPHPWLRKSETFVECDTTIRESNNSRSDWSSFLGRCSSSTCARSPYVLLREASSRP